MTFSHFPDLHRQLAMGERGRFTDEAPNADVCSGYSREDLVTRYDFPQALRALPPGGYGATSPKMLRWRNPAGHN
jgi:hypothetical protein